ncbi:hypothetical protein [Amycolatopsis sp. EV170708-02-1]|uniref:hypothetical protein n=1 Tax=Amycolatopsis sp. EV170708-02-1 TaxID=2919322 RepID=UPI001F0C88DF|nr:hypothetical protein [Amycolatopsis sp. EV170708-02-1]UMP07047.1 hypothetical protein MJQ72_20510 [Amycolatopsis sp. EV170708-02-1]
MLRLSRLFPAVAVVLMLAACGSQRELPSVPVVMDEYIGSTSVKNDRFTGGTSEERLTFLRANYRLELLDTLLLSAYRCGDGKPRGPLPSDRCDLNDAVRRALGADGGAPYARSLLVKRGRGTLELLTLYLAPGSGKAVDRTGRGYANLEDFRANNDLLEPEDLVLISADLTGVPGGPSVVVTGHTPPTFPWWLLGSFAAAAVAITMVAVLIRRRVKARYDRILGPGAV